MLLTTTPCTLVCAAYHWESVVQTAPDTLAWVNDHAWPFLSAVANFWACKLTKTPVSDGYEYWDVGYVVLHLPRGVGELWIRRCVTGLTP